MDISSGSINDNNNHNNYVNNDNDDEEDDESNQTFYEAAGEPELVLTFEKSLKTTNDVTSPLPPPPFSLYDINNADNIANVQKNQLHLDKNFVSVQMDKSAAAAAAVDGIDDMDEECEGAVGIVSTIKEALKDENEKELNLLYTTQDNFIQVEEEPPVVMRRKRDKSKFSIKSCNILYTRVV